MKVFYPLHFLPLSLFLNSIVVCQGYLAQPSSHPNLKQFAQAQLGKLMDIRFVVQSKAQTAATNRNTNKSNDSNNFALQGPLVRFVDQVRGNILKAMPVANGPNRRLSSGVKSLDIVKDGFVVDMNGMKTISFQNGSWEMAWKQGQRSGSLICAFDLPQHVRNTFCRLLNGSKTANLSWVLFSC